MNQLYSLQIIKENYSLSSLMTCSILGSISLPTASDRRLFNYLIMSKRLNKLILGCLISIGSTNYLLKVHSLAWRGDNLNQLMF